MLREKRGVDYRTAARKYLKVLTQCKVFLPPKDNKNKNNDNNFKRIMIWK